MKKLISVGFYRELTTCPEAQQGMVSIMDGVAESPQEHEEKMVVYLRKGICLGARGGYVNDVLDPSSRIPLVPHLYTDGTYLWRLDIAHYVEKYHLRLPTDFIRHMASMNWQPPTKQQVDMDTLDV